MSRGRRRYVIQKVAFAALTVFVVITFNFLLFRVLPGDPAVGGLRDPRLSRETVEALQERFGLNDPVFINLEGGNPFESQYFAYLGALIRGDLGFSFAFRDQAVASLLGKALVNTLWLVLPAQIISIVLGLGLGLVAAYKRGTRVDFAALVFSLIMWSLPTFFLGIVLLFLGSAWLGLPTAGKITIGAIYTGFWDQALDILRHLFLPTLTLALVLLGEYMLIMRSSVVEVLSEDYILTAKAEGLPTGQIIRRHAFRNAMLPIVTLIALNLGFTVSGAIQIETVFSWPGLGGLTVRAVGQRDFPVLQGAFLLLAVSVVLANLIVELIYGWLDPRVREA
ncbi:MAG: ABC transporter permease [Acidimicrobiia bacterium]|nr:MAG: ABC transporter permease [Acidimicrobiia bacterium]